MDFLPNDAFQAAPLGDRLRKRVRLFFLFPVSANGVFQELVFVEFFPELGSGSGFLRSEFHLIGQRLHGRAKKILNALRDMPLVLEMVLDAKHTIPADWTARLGAWTMPVERNSMILHIILQNRTPGVCLRAHAAGAR